MIPSILLACAPEQPLPPARLPDVVVVTLDTTRADRLGAWGYAEASTPALDALAARGRRYAQAYSPLPLTIPSHAAMFTGLYPARLGIRGNGDGRLGDERTTLAEVLHGEGYQTAASVAAYVTTREWGFAQGFDAYFDPIALAGSSNFWHAERSGDAVVDDALGWLEGTDPDRPVMLWVHLYDAHTPYTPVEPFLSAAEGRPYDAEIAFVDHQVGRLVEAFAGRDALFVVAADHGEALGQHGEVTHGLFVYEGTQHVPWILAGAGMEPSVVEQPVSLVDMMPTVLDALGLPVPSGLDGQVVPGQARPVYFEAWDLRNRFGIAPHVGVRDGDLKLIDLPRPELYAPAGDPLETDDLAAGRATDVERLRASIAAFGFEAPKGRWEIDPAVGGQLAALGYVEGTFTGDLDGPLPDPKDRMRMIQAAQAADRRLAEGDAEQAVRILAGLEKAHPEVIEFASRQASALARLGRHDEAAAIVERALGRDPENAMLMLALGSHRAANGQLREAADLLEAAATRLPYAPDARARAVRARLDTEPARGEELGAKWMAEYPDDLALAGVLGAWYGSRGRPEAWDLLVRGVQAEVPAPNVASLLAGRAAQQGDEAEAMRLLRLELEHHPENLAAARLLLARIAKDGDWSQEVIVASRVLDADPSDPWVWHAKAQAEFNLKDFATSRRTVDEALRRFPQDPPLVLLDANLLAKEGQRERGAERAKEAQRLAEAR